MEGGGVSLGSLSQTQSVSEENKACRWNWTLVFLTHKRQLHHGMTTQQKPQVFFPETPDKPQLAEHLLTKNRGNAAPLHQLLPVTLLLEPALFSLQGRKLG